MSASDASVNVAGLLMSAVVTILLISSDMPLYRTNAWSSMAERRTQAALLVNGRLTDRAAICQICFHKGAKSSDLQPSIKEQLGTISSDSTLGY